MLSCLTISTLAPSSVVILKSTLKGLQHYIQHGGHKKVICYDTDDLKTLLTTTAMALKGAEQVNLSSKSIVTTILESFQTVSNRC